MTRSRSIFPAVRLAALAPSAAARLRVAAPFAAASLRVATLWAAILCAAVACRSVAAPEESAAAQPAPERPPAAVDALDEMAAGTWDADAFPEVAWTDVDALLDRADRTRGLARWPINPLSSQMQQRCNEGVMALWMVEGLRRDEPLGFPSLNPLLLGGEDVGDWHAESERNQPRAAELYRRWWRRVAALPADERRAVDPLAGSVIGWH